MNKYLQQAVDSMARIDSEKEHLKDVCEKATEELGISKKQWNATVKEAFDASISEKIEEYKEVIDFMSTLK